MEEGKSKKTTSGVSQELQFHQASGHPTSKKQYRPREKEGVNRSHNNRPGEARLGRLFPKKDWGERPFPLKKREDKRSFRKLVDTEGGSIGIKERQTRT